MLDLKLNIPKDRLIHKLEFQGPMGRPHKGDFAPGSGMGTSNVPADNMCKKIPTYQMYMC
jgi:hypothetical protein